MRWLHRTVGLVFGAWLMLVGLTGAFLAFHWEIDTALNGRLLMTGHAVARPDFDAMTRTVRRAFPDRAILSIERNGLSDRETYPFILTRPLAMTVSGPDLAGATKSAQQPALEVFVDPGPGAIVGQRRYWTWFRVLKSFHKALFYPELGERIVGVLGVVLLTTVIAGVVLWWRESRRRLGQSLRLSLSAPMPRLLRDVHTVGGVYVALFLAIQACSGALVADLYPVQAFIGGLFDPKPAFGWPPPSAAGPQATITANAARDIALTVHPRSQVVQLVLPTPLFQLYSVRLYPTDQPVTRFTRQVLIDPASGKIILTFDPSTQPPLRRFFGLWMIWIHNGWFFGWPGRAVLVATGAMLTLLFPTGIYMWLRTRRGRKARSVRAAVVARAR